MAEKIIRSFLELAYSPVCNYDFSLIKGDQHFQALTSTSNLYMITQRNELSFDPLTFASGPENQAFLICGIRQKGNPSLLKVEIPLYQPNLAKEPGRDLKFHFEFTLPKPDLTSIDDPLHNVRNLFITYHDNTFVGWLSPEILIQNYLNGSIEAMIEGPIEEFIKYKVHYVGKATEQNVWKRLTGHSSLQDILSLEFPLHYGTLPTHEIAILFFQFREYFQFHTVKSSEKITDDIIDSALGRSLPSGKTISLDAEKAFIQAMQPKYNKEFYINYPKSKDGLYKYSYDGYSFQIYSNIVLEYKNGTIKGMPDFTRADAIVITRDQPSKIIKYSDASSNK